MLALDEGNKIVGCCLNVLEDFNAKRNKESKVEPENLSEMSENCVKIDKYSRVLLVSIKNLIPNAHKVLLIDVLSVHPKHYCQGTAMPTTIKKFNVVWYLNIKFYSIKFVMK